MFLSLSPSGQDHIEDILTRSLEVGTSDRKAAFHEYGTSKMPARKFIEPQEQSLDTIEQKIADWGQDILVHA
jgi:hypothetical protein